MRGDATKAAREGSGPSIAVRHRWRLCGRRTAERVVVWGNGGAKRGTNVVTRRNNDGREGGGCCDAAEEGRKTGGAMKRSR